MTDDIEARIAESLKLGSVGSSRWQAYTWKNELAEQKQRIQRSIDEILSEATTEHNPYHMLERAIGVAALCMRRLIECRLVTDKFRDSRLNMNEIHVNANVKWRNLFIDETAGWVFHNYDMTRRHAASWAPWDISNKMLHARVLCVLSASSYLPDGLLIASDYQHKSKLFHFTVAELSLLFDAFLDDHVTLSRDGFFDENGNLDPKGKVGAFRE